MSMPGYAIAIGRNLFAQSFQECRSSLDASDAHEISGAWTRMRRLSRGLDQEHFPG